MDDIAIIGMACRVAGADSPSKLWDKLVSSADLQSEITRYNSAGFYRDTGGPRKGVTNVRHAYFLDGDISRFDNSFFSIPQIEASAIDPQQRLLLEVAYEALENAGVTLEAIRGTDTAVYAGLSSSDYGTSLLRDIDAMPKYHSTGTSNAMAANRLSYFFDLHGPSMVIDTACSSTMVALHQAMLSLKNKEAGMALVCGANLIINPDMFVHMSELGFLSMSGKCQSFDAKGDGYARGEGIIALLVKPLGKALESGDPIQSIIRGSRINQDGRTNGITLPSSEAQMQNMEALYSDHNLSPGDVQYVEAHGTGTTVGDPSEVSAIQSVFSVSHRDHKLIVGSIKSNVGHLEACAALISVVKTVLCLEKGQIPAQLHFTTPNPRINFDDIMIPTITTNWPVARNGIRRAAINSFGFGGTNGHVVLDHFPLELEQPNPFQRPYLFKVSAANNSSLHLLSNLYADYVEGRKAHLGDLSYTLLARRSMLRKSILFTASNHRELVEKLRVSINSPNEVITRRPSLATRIGFVFTGQGAQWVGMGNQLIETSKLFAAVIDECDHVLSTLPDGPNWKITEELSKPTESSQIESPSVSQPICTALQLGLVEMWKAWGISPQAVIGHSSGEISAAYTAGFVSLRDAMIIAFYRGLHMGSEISIKTPGHRGAMCAVGLSEAESIRFLETYHKRVDLAAVNSPNSCTLAGDEEAIQEIQALCKENGTFCRSLRVKVAYHSHHMLPLAPKYVKSLRDAGISPFEALIDPKCDMFSSVTGRKLTASQCTPNYWAENMTSTVQFAAALTVAVKCHALNAIVELGPHPTLKGPALQTIATLENNKVVYFGSCSRNVPDMISMLETVGKMMSAGLPVLSEKVNCSETVDRRYTSYKHGKVLTDLPGYQWDHSVSFWAETRLNRNQRLRRFPRHSLLGARSSDDTKFLMVWKNRLLFKEVAWLKEVIHCPGSSLPPSAFILMALEAARQIGIIEKAQGCVLQLNDVNFLKELPLPDLSGDDNCIETHFNLKRIGDSPEFRFDILASTSNEDWAQYCLGMIRFASPPVEGIVKTAERPTHEAMFVEHLESIGFHPHVNIKSLHLGPYHAAGQFASTKLDDEEYCLDPTSFSSLLELPNMMMLGYSIPAIHRLESLDSLEVLVDVWNLQSGNFNVHVERNGPIQGEANLQIYNVAGHQMNFRGMHISRCEFLKRRPPLKSLFFRPELLPDITLLEPSESYTLVLSRAIEFVTHKWPMSDIGISGLSTTDTSIICSNLKGIDVCDRPRFRSLNIVSTAAVSNSGRIRTLNEFGQEHEFHLLFSSTEALPRIACRIRRSGIVCVRAHDLSDRTLFNESFDLIGRVDGFESDGWLLGRRKHLQNRAASPRKVKMFASQDCYKICQDMDRNFEYTELGAKIKEKENQPREPFDLIVLDCGERSILTTWAGEDFLPPIQTEVEQVENLLWITKQAEPTPFSKVAGGFIRTIQSEHPSMKAVNLHIEGECDPSRLRESILKVYDDIIDGSTEVELVMKDLQLYILRYQPDDELSAAVGTISPHVSSQCLGSNYYEVSLATPGNPILLSQRFHEHFIADSTDLCVSVEASVIDHRDARLFVGHYSKELTWQGLGQFFAGYVMSDKNDTNEKATCVFGWCLGAHKSEILVHSCHVFNAPQGMLPADAAVHYAAHCTALAIIHGCARARPKETFGIRLSGLLAEALTNICHLLGVLPILDPSKDVDFVVTFDRVHGLLLDGKEVSILKYMLSDLHQHYMRTLWIKTPFLKTSLRIWELKDLYIAFQNAETDQISGVLLHKGTSQIRNHILDYKPPKRLFKGDAIYILAGGLGGLGRFISPWMVTHGARHLVVLCRSGGTSSEARNTIQAVQDLGAEMQVFQTDLRDAQAVRSIICKVRKIRPIRGCINMVLALGNSPFLKMNPTQWDIPLRTKVDSSWNLHEATLSDELDIFIMFSSVSSISGNRTQSNYATGNCFQNSMAQYRRALSMPAIAIALGAMSEIGVLAEDKALLRTLTRSGLLILGPLDLLKVLEAAVVESLHSDRTLLSVGFEMFESIDNVIQSAPEQNQLFWTESPEFGFLLDYKCSRTGVSKIVSLKERLMAQEADMRPHDTLLEEFLRFLGDMLGYDATILDPDLSLASHGLDSLNAVACRYWFFKQLEVDVPVFSILGSRSIDALVSQVLPKVCGKSKTTGWVENIPQPTRHNKESLNVRPISHSQRRLWFLHQFIPDKTVYNLLLVCHISGSMDVDLFAKAWTVLVQRHEILYSKIVNSLDGLQQLPEGNPSFHLTQVDASESTFQNHVEHITTLARTYVFDIAAGELVHGWLLKSPLGWRFFLASHHLAWDRASVPTIFDETSTTYRSLANGEDPADSLSPLPYQFIDYTLWQEKLLSRHDLTQPHIDYWRSQLAGIPEALSLFPNALHLERPVVKQYAVDSVSLHLNVCLIRSLKDFCKVNDVTVFIFMTSALSLLIHRLTGDNDIVIGVADGDRGHTEFDRLIGFTVNMLAIRCKIENDMTYTAFLKNYRNTCLEAYQHRALPWDYILQTLDIQRRTNHSPVFQVTVNYQMQGSFPECDYGQFKFTQYDHYNARSQSDFVLNIEETTAGELHCIFDYDTSLYSEGAMLDVSSIFEVLLKNILCTNGLVAVDGISLVSVKDQKFISTILQPSLENFPLLEGLDTDLFPTLFSKAVVAYPEKPAIVDGVRSLTYTELATSTSRLAKFLIEHGHQIGDRVGIYCEPSVEMVIAVYGIVQAGCIYVPIDQDFPEERIMSMIKDVELETVLITDPTKKTYERLISCGISRSDIHTVNWLENRIGNCQSTKLSRSLDKHDQFCCIFTSGSTGRPKGIYLGHMQLRYQMESYHKFIATSDQDRVLLASAIVFDMSLTSIFGTILCGATLVIASREARYSPSRMITLLIEQKISNSAFTTTQLKMLLTSLDKAKLSKWTALRSVVVGGEQIPAWVIRDFYDLGLSNASLYNGYGPTETTVCNSLRKLTPKDSLLSITPLGPPLVPAEFQILDESCNPVPIGFGGELYIGGAVVNKGYIKRTEMTARVFLSDLPTSGSVSQRNREMFYRTGDQFKLMRNGSLQSMGRIGGDRQVKIRGMRTELDEIENLVHDALRVFDDLHLCSVTLAAVIHYKAWDSQDILAVYLATGSKKKAEIEAHQPSLISYLQHRLSKTLPAHMRPNAYVVMEDLPRTISGKVDYGEMQRWSPPVTERDEPKKAMSPVDRLTNLQDIVASIWCKVLAIDEDLLPVDDFFTMGGHSLLLLSVRDQVKRQCDVELSLAEMFMDPTIEGMENLILAQSKTHSETAESHSTLNDHPGEDNIDWNEEGSLPSEFDWLENTSNFRRASAVILTGACTMAGAHFINFVLLRTSIKICCIATGRRGKEEAHANVLDTLKHWRLFESIPSKELNRLVVYEGSLSHPTLGLNSEQMSQLDKETDAIFHLDSEVSLLKRYQDLRASNLGSIQFLISLARSKVNKIKAIHYLSTWGVPHLQAWNETELFESKLRTEVEMTNMRPGNSSALGYLKVRWACEKSLYQAAHRGIPVNIFRSCMCGSSPASGVPLSRTDINRGILDGCLQTGLVPDFGSERGGGMSWISADFLIQSIFYLSQRDMKSSGKTGIYHIISDRHILYSELPGLLGKAYSGESLRLVPPEEWFEAVVAKGEPEMTMQTEVLKQWTKAGWLPFGLQAKDTLELLRKERGLVPPTVGEDFLRKLVIGM